jgi:Arc/MetJ family transcription regulator
MMQAHDAVMRTTVSIDDHLLAAAKELALKTGRTLGEVVGDGLRLLLHLGKEPAAGAVELPTFGGSGLLPGVDLEDRSGLAAVLDEEG